MGFNGSVKGYLGGGNGSAPPPGGGFYAVIEDTIASDSATYDNPLLAGATGLAFIIVNDQVYSKIKGDYTFSGTTITGVTFSFFTDDDIVIPYIASS